MRRVLRFTAIPALILLALVSATATARADSFLGGGCGSVAPTFEPWGDLSDYYFPANGGFESGSTGWSLAGGAAVVGGNEPYYLHSRDDSHALALPSGGSAAVSVCYGVFYPALRFMVAGDATVHVWVTTRNILGVVSTLDGGTFVSDGGWSPSPKLSTLLSAIVAPLGTKSMQLHIAVTGGSALIDDLYVDPYLTKS